jgi:thymidylate kinase
MHYVKTIRDRSCGPITRIRDLFRLTKYAFLLKSHLRYQVPMLLTFSGIDGCGKTRYAEAFAQMFRSSELRTRYVWSRVGSARMLRPLASIGKKTLQKERTNGQMEDRSDSSESFAGVGHSHVRRGFLRLWTFIRLFELWVELTVKVRLPLFLGSVVICDRYYFDALVDLCLRFGWTPTERALSALARAFPRPDMAYLLKVDPESSRRRKPEEIQEDLAGQSKIYQSFAARFEWIPKSSEGSFSDTFEDMCRDVLRFYYHTKRWKGRSGE